MVVLLCVGFLWAGEVEFQKGIAYPSWMRDGYATRDAKRSLVKLSETGADYIAIVPTYYQEYLRSVSILKTEQTASTRSIKRTVARARKLGLHIMLKPHIDCLKCEKGEWRGLFSPKRPARWFRNYSRAMRKMARLAKNLDVEILCIGTELVSLTKPQYTARWRRLIRRLRRLYDGEMTYAANFDEYDQVEFWDKLDFIGIDAYFPVSYTTEPTVTQIIDRWEQEFVPGIEAVQRRYKMPVVFTEVGYRSIDGGSTDPHEHDREGTVDLQEQADCYEALFQVFFQKDWFRGLYIWNWELDPDAGGPNDTGYTPQNKPSEEVLRRWYGTGE